MKHHYCLLTLPLLAACAPQQQAATQLANDLKDNVYHTSEQVKKWAMTPPAGEGPPQPVRDSYCYYALQDILCYRQPMPGWERRLVGYQGTDAMTPPPAIMQPLPVHAREDDIQPASRVANARPLFVAPPPEVKEAPKDDGADGSANTAAVSAPDMTHEQLPNPALSPQL